MAEHIQSNPSHSSRYVEYIDVFSQEGITPSARLAGNVLLFDSFGGFNPLQKLNIQEPSKIYQMLAIYVVTGELDVEINGKMEHVTAKKLFTVMPENVSGFAQASPDLNYYMYVIYPKLTNQIFSDIGITYCNARMSFKHLCSPLSDEELEDTLSIYQDIKRDMLGPDYEFKQAYARNLLNAMIVKNLNIHQAEPIPLKGDGNSRQYDVYNRFITTLNKHCTEHRTVQYYAEQLGISSKYLSYVCICYSKKNASHWIDEAVIQKAKAMMLVHHYSISETSEALHFPNTNSYTRFFKRVTGITPKDFMHSQQE